MTKVVSLGRPPLPEGKKKLSSLVFRPTPDLKAGLENACKENGRSLSQEITYRLDRSFHVDVLRDLACRVVTLEDLICSASRRIRRSR